MGLVEDKPRQRELINSLKFVFFFLVSSSIYSLDIRKADVFWFLAWLYQILLGQSWGHKGRSAKHLKIEYWHRRGTKMLLGNDGNKKQLFFGLKA